MHCTALHCMALSFLMLSQPKLNLSKQEIAPAAVEFLRCYVSLCLIPTNEQLKSTIVIPPCRTIRPFHAVRQNLFLCR